MEFDTSTLMLIFFLLAFTVSFWKIYAFLPNKVLADDDTTKEAQEKLIYLVNKHNKEDMSSKDLLQLIKNDEEFDKEHFWRLNENKLNQLLIKMSYKY